MKRRAAVAGALGWASSPVVSRAQPSALRRVGVLAPSTAAREAVTLQPFFDEMLALGWTEGHDIVYDRVFGNDRTDDLRDRVVAATLPQHVPAVGHRGPMAEAGALFSNGASLPGQIRASAQVVDRILRGARPAETPVQQPTVFEFWLNLRSARALGPKPPQTVLPNAPGAGRRPARPPRGFSKVAESRLLLRADRLIE